MKKSRYYVKSHRPLAQRLEQRTHNPCVDGSIPSWPTNFLNKLYRPLAQRLEQRTHNPCVAGSNPAWPTIFS